MEFIVLGLTCVVFFKVCTKSIMGFHPVHHTLMPFSDLVETRFQAVVYLSFQLQSIFSDCVKRTLNLCKQSWHFFLYLTKKNTNFRSDFTCRLHEARTRQTIELLANTTCNYIKLVSSQSNRLGFIQHLRFAKLTVDSTLTRVPQKATRQHNFSSTCSVI